MENPLVDPLEPDFNGGVINPLLDWAGRVLPDRLEPDTPAGMLHRVVSLDNGMAEPLDSVFAGWFRGRLQSHAPYFVFSGLLALAWVAACCSLLAATLYKERRRRSRIARAAMSAINAGTDTDADAVDSRETAAVNAAAAAQSRYRMFFSMMRQRYRGFRDSSSASNHDSNAQSGNTFSKTVRNGSIGGVSQDSSCALGADTVDAPWTAAIRPAHLSAKALSGRSRQLVGHASVSAVVCLICLAFLVAYFTQAGGLIAFTSTAQSSKGVRTIVVATVGHLNRFLERSLFESNRTIINMFQGSYPQVEQLFQNFGRELLDLLMSDYKIDQLIGRLEIFLFAVNASVGAMRDIAGARETVIKPLQQFAAQLQVHRDGLRDPLAAMCAQHRDLFPDGRCVSLPARLSDLRLAINDTKLETDSSVTMVTLLNKMLKLDIDKVQRQVQQAKDTLSTGLQAISGVVKQLLGGLIETVASQFALAESAIARVKSGFDRVASDPQLWGAVEVAGRGVLALVILSCLVFALTCVLACVLLWALVRYLRIACRIDRFADVVISVSNTAAVAASSSPEPSEQSATSSPHRSSSSTSGFSSGGARSRSSPQWPPSLSLSPPTPPPPPPRLHTIDSFSERWLDLDIDCFYQNDTDAKVAQPPQESIWKRQPGNRQKLDRLVAKEWNGFVYCCSFDCSLLLLGCALLSLLPLLFGLAFFYASGEVQVDACRYLATPAGNQRWDSALDEFTSRRLWHLVQDALNQRPDLPIQVPSFPQRLIRAVRNDCADANRTLFGIFGFTGLLNATALLNANATRDRFFQGASLIKDQINATDANALIPPELESLTSVLPQLAGVLDGEDYTASIVELGRPLLAIPDARQFAAELDRLAATVAAAAPGDSNAAIVRHTVGQLNASLARSSGLQDRLGQLREHYRLLQASRSFSNMTTALLAALADVRRTLADKAAMLTRVDVRFGPTLERHLPEFAGYLGPLATELLSSVGHCDDLHRALETVAIDLCAEAVPRANVAAFLMLLTTSFFAGVFCLSWWLLVRVGRHQAVLAQSEVCAAVHAAAGAPSVASPPAAAAAAEWSPAPPLPAKPLRLRFESAV